MKTPSSSPSSLVKPSDRSDLPIVIAIADKRQIVGNAVDM